MYKTFTTGLSPVGKQANLAPLEEMHSPFGGWRHHLFRGEVRRSRIGGGERSEPVTRMPIITYDTKR